MGLEKTLNAIKREGKIEGERIGEQKAKEEVASRRC